MEAYSSQMKESVSDASGGKTLLYFTNCPFHIFRKEVVGKAEKIPGESKLGLKTDAPINHVAVSVSSEPASTAGSQIRAIYQKKCIKCDSSVREPIVWMSEPAEKIYRNPDWKCALKSYSCKSENKDSVAWYALRVWFVLEKNTLLLPCWNNLLEK